MESCFFFFANFLHSYASLYYYITQKNKSGSNSYLFICILTTQILMLSFLNGEKYVLSPKLHRTNLLCGHFLWQFCYATTFLRQVCWGIWNSSMKNFLDRSMHYYRFAPGFDFEFLSLTSRMNLLLWISNPRDFNSRNKPTFLPNLFTCGNGSNGFLFMAGFGLGEGGWASCYYGTISLRKVALIWETWSQQSRLNLGLLGTELILAYWG